MSYRGQQNDADRANSAERQRIIEEKSARANAVWQPYREFEQQFAEAQRAEIVRRRLVETGVIYDPYRWGKSSPVKAEEPKVGRNPSIIGWETQAPIDAPSIFEWLFGHGRK